VAASALTLSSARTAEPPSMLRPITRANCWMQRERSNYLVRCQSPPVSPVSKI